MAGLNPDTLLQNVTANPACLTSFLFCVFGTFRYSAVTPPPTISIGSQLSGRGAERQERAEVPTHDVLSIAFAVGVGIGAGRLARSTFSLPEAGLPEY
jgi:hypothetical protein